MTVLYLLVEESFREMASRQFIAADCLSKNLQVVIAQQWWFAENLGKLPRGLVLFKGNNHTQASMMRAAKDHGHLITSIEEEAFGVSYEVELATMFSREAMEVADTVFVQGTKHRDFLAKRFPEMRDRIAVTGNPRSDVIASGTGLASKEKAARLRQEFGDFVLVNTNCGAINPFDIDTYSHFNRCANVGVLDPADPNDLERFESLLAWEHSNLREINRFLRGFAESHPDIPVIVRPHPSERMERWSDACEGLASVRVENDKDHVAWMLAARVMLHTGCTTGLEGALLGTPVVGICPDDHVWHDGFISNVVSHVFKTGEEARRAVADHLAPNLPDLSNLSTEALNRLQPSLYVHRSQRASRRMAEVLAELAIGIVGSDSLGALNDLGHSRGWLGGRRHEKAFVTIGDFETSWASVKSLLECPLEVSVEELAPSVFWMKTPE
jgi:surface carbohydrate biosynthesis protein